MSTLDERSRMLLKALVERYIVDGEPVGSRTLAKALDLSLSPATIRNVMSDLEELGLVASPHTSAGRVPTPRAYRLFVDTMLTSRPPQVELEGEAANVLRHDTSPSQVLSHAASLLSELSHFVGVVKVPRRAAVLHQVEFLRLASDRILLILVSPDGEVQNRILHTRHDFSQDQLTQAANFLNANYHGLPFEEVHRRLQGEVEKLRSQIATLLNEAVVAGSEMGETQQQESVFIAGQRRLLDITDLASDLASLRRLFDLFEQKTQLLRLLEISSRSEGVRIYIGGESEAIPYEELSVITAPYSVHGQVVGTLGVIGPTRMSYGRVMQIVDVTARLVGSALHRVSPGLPASPPADAQ